MANMKTDFALPSWMDRAFGNDQEDNIVVWTRVHTDAAENEWFFTGMVSELIRLRKIPRRLDIALDLAMGFAIVRMEYDPGPDGRDKSKNFRALYTFMDVESFALLWNYKPPSIHGFPANAISLHFNDNSMPWPSRVSSIPTLITFDASSDQFLVQVDVAHVNLEELEEA